LLLGLLADGMAGGNVSHLVPKHSHELSFIVKLCQDAAGEVYVTSGHREGIYHWRVNHLYMVFKVGSVGYLTHLRSSRLNKCLKVGIFIDPECGQHLGVIRDAQGYFLGFRHKHDLLLSRNGIYCAGYYKQHCCSQQYY